MLPHALDFVLIYEKPVKWYQFVEAESFEQHRPYLILLEKSMFLVPQVPTKYRLGPSRFFGIHLVPQVSKPDKSGPKPDFDPVDRHKTADEQ